MTASIEYAEAAMSKARTSVEKAQASKENRQKVVSKASEIVNALLEPASQVANLLDGIASYGSMRVSRRIWPGRPGGCFRFRGR